MSWDEYGPTSTMNAGPHPMDWAPPKAERQPGPANDILDFVQLEPLHPSLIPPRPWAYGKFLLFGSAAVIGALDGAGKGAVAVAMIIATITGKETLGERVWRSGPVLIVTYEDDTQEWRRRLAAACMHFAVDYTYVMANVHFVHKPGGKVVFAQQAAKGGLLFPDGDAIITGMKAIGAVLLLVDPFNTAHEMDDGNNNVLVARVAHEMSRIAKESGAAVLVLHHLRKGSTGDVDDLMGATSLRANFRSCRILVRMTTEQAKQLGLPERQHWRYLRIAGTKGNYAPPPEKVTWFRLASVPLGNPTDLYPEGDEMGVAHSWEPPPVFEGIDLLTLRDIFAALTIQPEPGWHYGADVRAKYWAGKIIIQYTDKTREQASKILKTWKENEVFHEQDYETPHRDTKKRLVLNQGKIAQMVPSWEAPEA